MGLFDKLFQKKEELTKLENITDSDIVAIADGEIIDVKTVSDPVFAEEMLGKSIAFKFDKSKVTLCSPANGILSVLFPTGHAYGVTTNEGVEILVHCGVNTVCANGNGFKLLKKQGDKVNAGDPIIEVNIKELSKQYDMSTILILTNTNEKEMSFITPTLIKRGETVLK